MTRQLGNAQKPIIIDNDQENQANLIEMLEAARNRAIIQEAEITNQPLELCFAVAKTAIKGELEVKNRQVNKFILNYFKEKIKIKISHQYFFPRPEPDYTDIDAMPNLQQLVIYGVDFLTTNGIKDRLQTLNTQIQQIIWINASTCKIICRSPDEADLIIKNQLKYIKIEQESESFKDWHSIKSYIVFAFERPLFLRYSLINQNFNIDKSNQKYQQFLQAKKTLPLKLLQNFNAVEKYKEVVRQIYQKNFNQRKRHNFHQNRNQEYSRSRQKNRNNFRKQQERAPPQRRYKRQRDRLTDNPSSQQFKKVNQAHEPAYNNQQDSYSINQRQQRQPKQPINTDFIINHTPVRTNNKLNTSFEQAKKKKEVEHLMLFDQLSEVESNLSYNYNNLAVGAQKEDENRLDYHYSPYHESNSNDDDLQYQLEQSPKKKTSMHTSFVIHQKKSNAKKDLNESFIQKSKASREEQSSDFFDFNQSLRPNKNQSTLNSSFRFEPKDKKVKKPISNFEDDYSY